MPSTVPSLHFQTRDKLLNAVCLQIPIDRISYPFASITQLPPHAVDHAAAQSSKDWQSWAGDLVRRTYDFEDPNRYSSERVGECTVYCFPTSAERNRFVSLIGAVRATLVRIIPG